MTKNLCTDPWIPVTLTGSGTALLGLKDLFARLEGIRDLVLSPKERIAVMRLLLCIAQRALDGPEDAEAREECREDIIPRSMAYLQQWKQSFDMSGENGAFLQVPGLQGKEFQPVSKLDMALSSGNNPTLFDNAGGTAREMDFSRVALNLLTFQNFAPPGMIGVAEWAGKPTANKSPDSCQGGPCSVNSALHIFLTGKNLLDTLWMNLIPRDSIPKSLTFGKPVWEEMPQSMDDRKAIDNASLTYLGRLVPVSRSIRLLGEPIENIILARGITYPSTGNDQSILYYESTTRRTRRKDGKLSLVGAKLSRAIWRSLPAMLQSLNEKQSKADSRYDNEKLPERFDLWIGALVINKAKIEGEMESRFPHLDSRIFAEDKTVNIKNSLEKAEQGGQRLYAAICSYHAFMGNPHEEREKKTKNRAMEIYWEKLNSRQDLFLSTAMGDTEKADREWQLLIAQSSRAAYDAMCPHSTDRQLEAWAKGWKTYSNSST